MLAPVPSPGHSHPPGPCLAALGPADEAARSLFFRDVDDSVLVDDGTKVETSTILASVPTFLVSCANILGALSAEQEASCISDPAIFGVLVSETEASSLRRRSTMTPSAPRRAGIWRKRKPCRPLRETPRDFVIARARRPHQRAR